MAVIPEIETNSTFQPIKPAVVKRYGSHLNIPRKAHKKDVDSYETTESDGAEICSGLLYLEFITTSLYQTFTLNRNTILTIY